MNARVIVLAAGKGTRMKSATPKVLHEICGRPMIWYVLRALAEGGFQEVYAVTAPSFAKEIEAMGVQVAVQDEQLGTGHAAKIALSSMKVRSGGCVLIVPADMPLVSGQLYRDVADALEKSSGASLALVTTRIASDSNFGRIVRRNGNVERIVEVRDATRSERSITEGNAAIYAYDEDALRESVERLENKNAQKEYYLTDTIADFVKQGKQVVPVPAPDDSEVIGINDRAELALARRQMNARLCDRHMREGVTIVDPLSTYLEPEVRIGADTVIYPNTSIGRLSTIGERCVIGPNSRLSNAKLGSGVTVRESVVTDSSTGNDTWIGPFAQLRNNARLGNNVRIGNFVEIKDSRLYDGVKVNHLTYIGDAEIGAQTNIGAGTITCNYDGFRKNKTTIGRNVMIGSNTSLIAPVTVGDGALTGAGSVVTKDVPPGERVAGNPARPLKKE